MGKRFKRSWSTAAPRKTMRGRRTHTCRGRAAPSWGSHGQRQFRGWLSGRWAGGRACSPHGAALQDLPRLAAKRCDGLQGKDRLLEPCRKQRRFDPGQPEPNFKQRGSGQDAGRQRLDRPQLRRRLSALDAVVRHERVWRGGWSRRHMDGHGRTGERSEDEEGSKPPRKPGLQLVAAMRPRAHRHLGRLPRATGGRPSRRKSAAAKDGPTEESGQVALTGRRETAAVRNRARPNIAGCQV
jgi:hypothetical protein